MRYNEGLAIVKARWRNTLRLALTSRVTLEPSRYGPVFDFDSALKCYYRTTRRLRSLSTISILDVCFIRHWYQFNLNLIERLILLGVDPQFFKSSL